jgi:hypothetical protein
MSPKYTYQLSREAESLCLELAMEREELRKKKGVDGKLATHMPKAWSGFKQRTEWRSLLEFYSLVVFDGEKPILASDAREGRKYTLKVLSTPEADRIRKKLRKTREREVMRARARKEPILVTNEQVELWIKKKSDEAFELGLTGEDQ